MYPITEQAFQAARVRLSRYSIECAARLAREVGFSYEESPVAPSTFAEVQREYDECRRTHRAFRVWNGASDNTAYTSREANWSFRFYHDVVSHGAHGLTFSLADELESGNEWVRKVASRFGVDSVESWIAYCDTCGESLYADEHGGLFPNDQCGFVHERLLVGSVYQCPWDVIDNVRAACAAK